jgi:hypothetical protein
MIDSSTTPKEAGKLQFFLTGFAQAAGIRTYAFQGRIDASRIECTVEVDLSLIPGYGIRIQDLPLLCRELLQQQGQPEESAIVFTEQRMRNHAEKLAAARLEAEHKKKQPKHLATAAAGTSEAEAAWRPHLR